VIVIKKAGQTDFVGMIFAITTALLAIGTVIAHVYCSAHKPVDAGTTFLLNLLALTFTTACTIWVGRWSARRENRSFIRAALRTTYGMHDALQAAERTALDGIARQRTRSDLAAEISSQFWEDLVGRVLDQVRGVMRQAQETVENWKEFGPEEVERLAAAETVKAQAVDEMAVAIDQARSMLRELKELGVYDTAGLRARVDALEQEKARITATAAFAIPASGEARRLMAHGASEEAVAAYSSLIAISPQNYTLYIARARARYLAGDSSGALQDLDIADGMHIGDPTAIKLREDIIQGRKLPPPTLPGAPPEYKEHVYRGNSALAAGEPEEAQKHFDLARDAGLMPIYVTQNKAMALLVAGRYEEAKNSILSIQDSLTGPFVKTQGLIILALADALEELSTDSEKKLRDCLAGLHVAGLRFALDSSAIQFALRGLEKRNALNDRARKLMQIFDKVVIDLIGETEHGSAE